jgi:hypothetical protein
LEAVSERHSRTAEASVLENPTAAEITTGKKLTKVAKATRDPLPMPSQTTNNGASATFGISWKKTQIGVEHVAQKRPIGDCHGETDPQRRRRKERYQRIERGRHRMAKQCRQCVPQLISDLAYRRQNYRRYAKCRDDHLPDAEDRRSRRQRQNDGPQLP